MEKREEGKVEKKPIRSSILPFLLSSHFPHSDLNDLTGSSSAALIAW